jgi:hypothetical protein
MESLIKPGPPAGGSGFSFLEFNQFTACLRHRIKQFWKGKTIMEEVKIDEIRVLKK